MSKREAESISSAFRKGNALRIKITKAAASGGFLLSHEGELTAHLMAAGAANRHKAIVAQNDQTVESA
jgi:hypothetical protein